MKLLFYDSWSRVPHDSTRMKQELQESDIKNTADENTNYENLVLRMSKI